MTSSYLTFSIWLLLIAIALFAIFLIAQNWTAPSEPTPTLEKFYPNSREFEATLRRAQNRVHESDDFEFLSILQYLYYDMGMDAPMTLEAFNRLNELAGLPAADRSSQHPSAGH